MKTETLHITSGDLAGDSLSESGIPGQILVWHDILYDGPRKPGWPDRQTLRARALFIEESTAKGLDSLYVLEVLQKQYEKLKSASAFGRIVLWFDACLFDQSMLAHLLACLQHRGFRRADLLCVDEFPGIKPYNGLGQLSPDQLASVYDRRRPVTEDQFRFAEKVDEAFATQDKDLFIQLSGITNAPLPWVPAAVRRWLQEQPHPETGLGRLEQLALEALRAGCKTPLEIFSHVAAADEPPQYWGDITLWAKINALADRNPALVEIQGPASRLPQWESDLNLKRFVISVLQNQPDNDGSVSG